MFNPVQLDQFTQRTGIGRRELTGIWDEAERIVSLRDLAQVLNVQAMPKTYLRRLLENITLAGDDTAQPYRDCRIQTMRVDPRSLMVGQTFIERSKYTSLVEDFPDLFANFCVAKGFAKLTAQIVLGRLTDGEVVIAHYLPPIVEQHNSRTLLLDGMHRNYILLAAGTTVEAVKVHGVKIPFPCTPQRWDAVRSLDAKPPENERYFNLRPDLFRDIKSVGIDG